MSDLAIVNAAEVLTCARGAEDLIGLSRGAGLIVNGGRITAVGRLRPEDVAGARTVVDADGGVMLPGFVDCHTHVVFGGSRLDEFAARAARKTPGPGVAVGILGTAAATRELSVEALVDAARPRLQAMLDRGTTTVESKSGYGLTPEAELRILEANRELGRTGPIDIVSTYLGAHAIPLHVQRDTYVASIIEAIPEVASRGLASFCDVYCDDGYFTAEETRRILMAGLDHGLRPKIHLDAYSATGGAAVAIEVGAVSVDHLNYTSSAEVAQLASAGIVGVCMPVLDLAVEHPAPLNPRDLIDGGLAVALATDVCPACPAPSMQLAIALATRAGGLSVAEAIRAATLGAADALALGGEVGSLEPGKRADIVILDVSRHEELAYRIGENLVRDVVKGGVPVVGEMLGTAHEPTQGGKQPSPAIDRR